MASPQSIGERVRAQWDRLSQMPGGKQLFSFAMGRMAPYTGTIGARVEDLRPGYARVTLRDRKKVRNHLRSVHAIALLNLGEVTTGLAMLAGLPADARGILTGLSMDYHKKARGLLTAECTCDVPSTSVRTEYIAVAELRDQSGDVVATARAKWLIGPRTSDGVD